MGVKCAVGTLLVGGTILTLGLLLPTVFNSILNEEVEKMLPLVNGSYAFEMWRTLPVPMYIQIYVFDVINADEVIAGTEKPYLVERGPYTYRLKKEKVNITYNENMTVTYRQKTWYYFDRDLSVGDESDNFTSINNILLGATYMTRFQFPLVKEMLKLALDASGQRLYETYSIKDILWGYEDPLLKLVKDDILDPFHLGYLFDDHFGFFYKWNGSDQGQFTVYTGQGDLQRLNRVNTFNGLSEAPYWSNHYARMLNGTDGTFFAPFLDKNKPLYFYAPDACRTFVMNFQEENSVKDISTYRYTIPASMLENATANPDNSGFCTPTTQFCMPSGVLNVSSCRAGKFCMPSGVLNVSSCRAGSSAIMSLPHFLGGDPEVLSGVNGLNPDPVLHSSYLDLEPITGVPIDVGMKLQIGVYVSKFADIIQLKNTKKYFHPVFWFNETTVMTDDLAGNLRDQLLLVVKMVNVLQYLLPCLGALVFLGAFVYLIRRHRNKKKKSELDERSPLLKNDEDN